MLRTKLLLVMAAAMILLQAIVWALVVWGEFGDEYERLLARQDSNLMTSATILDAKLPEVSVTFGEDAIEQAETIGFPQFETHDVIDSIGRATNATATIFAFDPANGEFWRRSTNIIKPDGTRAVGTELGKDNPVHAFMLRGETFAGEATILGIDYVTIYQPLFDSQTGAVTGILYVGTPKAAMVEAIWASAWEMVLETVATLALTFALLAFLLNQMVLKGLVRIQGATLALTRGERTLDIADRNRGDEIGQIARNLEDLRQSLSTVEAAQARALQTEEAGRQKLASMLTELDREVSGVVQAVGEGDLSRTISARFDVPEIQSLASAVNRLRDRMQGFAGDIGSTLRAMAAGDLTQSMPQTYSGAFGEIASDANGALDRLGAVFGQALDAVAETRSGIAKIDRASHDLGSRVEEQAAALQQTAATMEEMAASVKANAKSLAEAETAAVSARDTSRSGSEAATAAVEAVGRIAESSNQIGEILKVIDSIAFQTNLLALNAAVEAARAGDAGKGFAVVANEVGNLARQSSQAAREIGELVNRNQGSVDEGVRMVEGAGSALAKIADEIRRLTDRVAAVSLAGREQSTGIEEVNRAVSGLDQMTQENATLTESATAQVGSVNAQMERLSNNLAGLRLPGRGSMGHRAAA